MNRLRILAVIVVLIAPAWAAQVLSRIVVSPAATWMSAGQSKQFTAQAFDTTGKVMTVGVSWSVSLNGAYAHITAAGLFTSNVAAAYDVRATNGRIYGQTTFTVKPRAVLAAILASPVNITIPYGYTHTVTVHEYDQYGRAFGPVAFALNYASTGAGQPISVVAQTTTSITFHGNKAGSENPLVQVGTIKSNGFYITVSAAPYVPPFLKSIVVAPAPGSWWIASNASIEQGTAQAFTALGIDQYGDAINAPITWSVTNGEMIRAEGLTAIAYGRSASLANSIVTASVAGVAYVHATSGKVVSTSTLTVIAPHLARIAVTPTSASVVVGHTQQFSAQGFDQYGHSIVIPALTWRTTNADATIANTGVAVGVSSGSVSIDAVSGSVIGDAALTVTPRIPTSLTITPVPNLVVGQTAQSTATVKDQFGVVMNVPVSWYSSSPAAKVTNGLVTGVSAGVASIGASYGSLSDASGFTVIARVLTTITVTSPASSIYTGAYGSTAQLTAQGFDQFGVPFSAAFTWSSDNAAVATVGTGGLVTGVTPGTAHISAHSETLTGSIAMAVVQEPSILTTITVSPGSGTTYVDGKPFQFSAVARDQFNNLLNVAFTWTSTAPATVDSTGLVTGVGAGTANITASASLLTPELNKTFSVTSNTATLSVGSAPALHSITTYPPSVTLAVAEPIGDLPNTTPLGATSIDQYGNTLQETYTWTSSNPAVASVDASGNVVGLAVGTAQITASALGVNSTAATINVTNAPSVLTALTVNPPSPSVFPGGIVSLTPTALDQFNNPFPVAFTWLSDSSNATVDSNGNVTGVVAGTADITVYAGSLSASSAITVEQVQDVSSAWVFTFVTVGGGTAQITAALQQSAGAITCAPYTTGGVNALYWPPSNNLFYGDPSQYETCSGVNFDNQITLQLGDVLGNTTTLTGTINPAAPTILNGNITGTTPQDYQFAGAFTGQQQ